MSELLERIAQLENEVERMRREWTPPKPEDKPAQDDAPKPEQPTVTPENYRNYL